MTSPLKKKCLQWTTSDWGPAALFHTISFCGGRVVGETEKHDSNYVMRKSKEFGGKEMTDVSNNKPWS